MSAKDSYDIAVVAGEGIGPEVCDSTIAVLKAAVGDKLTFSDLPGGAECWAKTGSSLPETTLEACRAADAILHGAAGLPTITRPDGTEPGADLTLGLRFALDMYANIRHVKGYAGAPCRLADKKPSDIDHIVLRENTEGLYASRDHGIVMHDEVATETLVITRKGTERVARMAFELARKRNGAPADGVKRVTCCDKSNILRAYAFFRGIVTEVAQDYPDIELDFCIVDAMTTHLILRPEHYDVIVSENMFGDIISDLSPATVGGLGMSPSAEIGDAHGMFQASHGTAPDIAGQGIANPTGTILSGVMMLEWLAERFDDAALRDGAENIRSAVTAGLADGSLRTRDLGGEAGTQAVTDILCKAISGR